jgi:hypothetical protein
MVISGSPEISAASAEPSQLLRPQQRVDEIGEKQHGNRAGENEVEHGGTQSRSQARA